MSDDSRGSRLRVVRAHCDGLSDIPFLDAATMDAIEWPAVWRQFQPQTPYGLRIKAEFVPFRLGQELGLEAALKQLGADLMQFSSTDVERVQGLLRELPDITEALQSLSSSNATLTPKSLLALKQFAFRGQALVSKSLLSGIRLFGARVSDTSTSDAYVADESIWLTLLQPFGKLDSPSFSLRDVAEQASPHLAHAWVALTENHGAAVQEKSRLIREEITAWQQETGVRPRHAQGNRGGGAGIHLQLSLPHPALRDVTDGLKSDPRVKWLQDTPFESVFDIPPPPRLIAAEQRLADITTQLDELGAQLVAELCRTLHNQLAQWHKAVQAVTDLDIRLAKVRFARDIAGSVPIIGETVELEDAAHPIVLRRLANEGKSYTPITLRPILGSNILCGPNMGGKTVAMSLLALCQALVQYGMAVPARRFQTRLFGIIRFRESAPTDVRSGLSSFGAEVTALRSVWEEWQQSTCALICFDEPGRTTNPVEGEALALGIILAGQNRCEESSKKGEDSPGKDSPDEGGLDEGGPDAASNGNSAAKSLLFVATHFSGAMQTEGARKFRVRGVHRRRHLDTQGNGNSLEKLEQMMDYTIERVDGAEVPLEAMEIARWLGMPEDILEASTSWIRTMKGK